MLEYLLYFIVGGSIVSLVVGLAKSGHPFLSGVALVFPSVTLISMYFIGRSAGTNAVVESAKSAILSSLIVWLPYIATIAYLAPRIGVNRSLIVAFVVFLLFASAMVFLYRRYGLA